MNEPSITIDRATVGTDDDWMLVVLPHGGRQRLDA
jgi:hypothetical protein